MGFSLLSEGATPPEWSHVVCAGSGFAWHEDEDRRRCYVGEVSVDAPIVAAAIDGRDLPGVDRVLAFRDMSQGSVVRVFRRSCPACGADHAERATRCMRAVRHIHPGAIEALRKACVPEWHICEPTIRKRDEEPKKRKRSAGLPVIVGDNDATRDAQILFAVRYSGRNKR